MNTISGTTKYIVELFPVTGEESSTSGDTELETSISSGVFKPSQTIENIFRGTNPYNKMKKNTNSDLFFGINSIKFARSKHSAESLCNFSITGRLHPSMIPGTWVVISAIVSNSVNSESDANYTRIIKYIGQIHTIQTSFTAQGDGLLSTTNSVNVREWSHVLSVPIRYDVYSIFHESQNDVRAAIGALSSVTGFGSQKTIDVLTGTNFDPFTLAHAVLTLVGMISSVDRVNPNGEVDYKKYESLPKFATRTPYIPDSLKQRLDLDSGFSLIPSKDPSYAQGFVKVLTGIQKEKIYTYWDGIWKNKDELDEYKDILYKGYQSSDLILPSVNGANLFTQIGKSAWEMLTQYCNNSFTEVFSDLAYISSNNSTSIQGGDSINNVFAQPYIMIRDKPFMMKRFNKEAKHSKGLWTYYDDLPRIKLSSASIISINFQNTCVTSPNYIRAQFDSSVANRELINSMSINSNSIQVLQQEQEKFGGQEMFMYTFFIPKAQNSVSKIFGVITEAGKFWYSYLYKMFDAVLVVKEDGIALSVGYNLTFKIGEYELVGHIESFETQFSIDMNGLEHYTTRINLSRVVMVSNTTSGDLDFIPLEDISVLPFKKKEDNQSDIFDMDSMPDFSDYV